MVIAQYGDCWLDKYNKDYVKLNIKPERGLMQVGNVIIKTSSGSLMDIGYGCPTAVDWPPSRP
jgi:hypothetical protein